MRILLFYAILFFTIDSYGNSDSTQSKSKRSNAFSISNNFKSNDIYLGTYSNAVSALYNSEIRFDFKFGLFLAVSPDVLISSKRGASLSDIGFSIGYDQVFGEEEAWNVYAGYTFYWQNVRTSKVKVLNRFRNIQNHNFNAGVSFENDYLSPSIEMNYLTGEVSDLVITPQIAHKFYFVESDEEKNTSELYLEPYNRFNFGTANNILIFDNPNVNDAFSLLNMEIGLRLNYSIGFFEIEPLIEYSHSFRSFTSKTVKNGDVFFGALSVNFNF
ncbi:MAG: hypothetical protein IPK03_08630 [Bacteroidetes bacterium]|nr:hypothetical protein [Bacteroidota bacterium]